MRIVADSSCDLNDELRSELDVTLVPLTIQVEEEMFTDNPDLDVHYMLDRIAASPEVPRSACPSPQDFINAFMEQGSVFVVTMTSALSGTYNSALLGKNLFKQDHTDKFIHIFDSKGSSVKETLVALKIRELINARHTEPEIVEKVNEYLRQQKFFFQLGSLDPMVKNGRITKLKGFIANILNIRPILYGNEHGEVELYENVRSEKKSIKTLVDLIGNHCDNFSERVLGISHCEAHEKAMTLKAEIEARYNFKRVVVVPTGGLSSMYMSRGGITIAF